MTRHRSEWIIIGISGVTCGGKTTLSNKLIEMIVESYVLHQDKYFLPDDHPRHVLVPGLEPRHNNYDILSALDMEQMHRDAISIIEGEDKSHGRGGAPAPGKLKADKKVLILEGFTAINYRPLYELCDLRYYFILEYGECFARRVHRLYDPPDVAGYFEMCVWPEHLRFRAELENDPNVIVLDGTQSFSDTLALVIRDLKRLGCVECPNTGEVEIKCDVTT